MFHLFEDFVGHGILFCLFLKEAGFLNAGKRTRNDEEAGQKDPGREGGKQIVRAGDLVEGKEHICVAG